MKKQLLFLTPRLIAAPSLWGQTIGGQEVPTTFGYGSVCAVINLATASDGGQYQRE